MIIAGGYNPFIYFTLLFESNIAISIIQNKASQRKLYFEPYDCLVFLAIVREGISEWTRKQRKFGRNGEIILNSFLF